MKHPKTCNGCKAFWQSTCHYHCSLGYEIKAIKTGSIRGTDLYCPRPADGECLKPMTYRELFDAKKAR